VRDKLLKIQIKTKRRSLPLVSVELLLGGCPGIEAADEGAGM